MLTVARTGQILWLLGTENTMYVRQLNVRRVNGSRQAYLSCWFIQIYTSHCSWKVVLLLTKVLFLLQVVLGGNTVAMRSMPTQTVVRRGVDEPGVVGRPPGTVCGIVREVDAEP